MTASTSRTSPVAVALDATGASPIYRATSRITSPCYVPAGALVVFRRWREELVDLTSLGGDTLLGFSSAHAAGVWARSVGLELFEVPRSSPYEAPITAALERIGRPGANPRHVESYMRLKYGTLDALSPMDFDLEVSIGVAASELAGEAESEALAQTYFPVPRRCCSACAGTMSLPDGSRCRECDGGTVAV